MLAIYEFLGAIGVRLAGLAMFFLAGFLIEAIIPIEDLKTGRHLFFNCVYAVLYRSVDVILGSAFVGLVFSFIGKLPIHGTIPLASLAGWTLPILTLAIYDFFYYWMHRTQHFSRWLWAAHELHHSDEQVDVTTVTRHHYFELVLMPIFIYAPISILFDTSGRMAMSWAMVTTLFSCFIHMNARIGFGPFNRVLANPQVHRIHHSRLPQHSDKNFAAYFSFWDVLFGTYYHPQKGEYPPSGLSSGRTITSQIEAALMPVQAWARMLQPSIISRPQMQRAKGASMRR